MVPGIAICTLIAIAGGSALKSAADLSDREAIDGSQAAASDPPMRAPVGARSEKSTLERPSRGGTGDQPRRGLRVGPPTAAAPPVRIPEDGPGTFAVAPGATEVVGAGELVSYTVEVEDGIPLDVREVASVVDATLGDPRSWTAGGARALRRLAGVPDVRVLLATPETTDELCAPLLTGGRLSCRNGDLVVLNAWRWMNGAEAYDDLDEYRRYLINHEFGHALGNSHQYCAEPGDRASVMLQQTKGLQGCRENPWPAP